MKTATTGLASALIVLALGSTATFSAEPQVNCDTAAQDIAHLESEKKSSLEQAEKGVTSIMPSTAALHMITGTQQESKEIASGEYNDKIDAHIALIKSTCGME
jgi:hypothetical protein